MEKPFQFVPGNNALWYVICWLSFSFLTCKMGNNGNVNFVRLL